METLFCNGVSLLLMVFLVPAYFIYSIIFCFSVPHFQMNTPSPLLYFVVYWRFLHTMCQERKEAIRDARVSKGESNGRGNRQSPEEETENRRVGESEKKSPLLSPFPRFADSVFTSCLVLCCGLMVLAVPSSRRAGLFHISRERCPALRPLRVFLFSQMPAGFGITKSEGN